MATYSRHVADFEVAGIRFWDGALVLDQIKVGDKLDLFTEDDNPNDPNAVALYWHDTKIGYIPSQLNSLPATLLHFGHRNVLECHVLKVDTTADTWNQIQAGLYVVDKAGASI